MAKTDGTLRRGMIVYSREDGLQYMLLAVFQETVWMRDIRTKKVIKGFPKKDIYW